MKGPGYIAFLAILAVVCSPMLTDAAPNPDGWYKLYNIRLINVNMLSGIYIAILAVISILAL